MACSSGPISPHWNKLYLLLSLLLLQPTICKSTSNAVDIKDYCLFETFNATCRSDEVVIMTAARYGRMQFGRCVNRDYGYVGCSADVLPQVDERCSGRRKCTITVPDSDLHDEQPCPKDLSAYLQAAYKCEKVISPGSSSCPVGQALLTAPSGSIASVVSHETGHGTDSCPWVIRVNPGKRINITLWDFSIAPDTYASPEFCKAYAIIRERPTGTSTTVCGGAKRFKGLHVSRTNEVEIRIIFSQQRETRDYFILRYESFGCETIKVPEGTTVKYENNMAEITCGGAKGKTWKVVCEEGKWKGDLGNCTKDWSFNGVARNLNSLPTELTVALIAGIAFVVIVFVLVIGLFCLRKRRVERNNIPPSGLLVDVNYKDQYSPGTLLDKEKAYASTMTMRQAKPRSFSGEYASIWETQYPGSPVSLPPEGVPYYPSQDGIDQYGGMTEPTMVGGYEGGQVPVVGYRSHPRVEHIYESPKFERSAGSRDTGGELPVYYELDPELDAARNIGAHGQHSCGHADVNKNESKSNDSSLQRSHRL